jgi:acetate kinase
VVTKGRDAVNILTVNGGSSSIKFACYAAGDSLRCQLAGGIERIGQENARFWVEGEEPDGNFSLALTIPDHAAATGLLLQWFEERGGPTVFSAVGHRVVHGGPHHSAPQCITPEMLETLRALRPFDPEHLPAELLLLESFQQRFPELPQVACFDTAFHHDLPRVAQLLPIPRRYQEQGVRRYGFHGLSYAFLMEELARLDPSVANGGRVILAHLGNGASLAAVHDGKPIDTSMGFTPAAGIPMSSRAGDLDPGLVGYLARSEGMSAMEFNRMINSRSGLLGVSGSSADMQTLLEKENTDEQAAEAVSLFCYQAKKWIGGFAAALGGVDMLVFSGGIGENAPLVRERICEGLAFLGIEIDAEKNSTNAGVISSTEATVRVRVIHTNEELVIARSVQQLIQP